jgi:hypothetical protein
MPSFVSKLPVKQVKPANLMEQVNPPAGLIIVQPDEAEWIRCITKVQTLPNVVEGLD